MISLPLEVNLELKSGSSLSLKVVDVTSNLVPTVLRHRYSFRRVVSRLAERCTEKEGGGGARKAGAPSQ